MGGNSGSNYQFGRFRLNVTKRVLLENGEAVPLTPKAFDLLLILVRNRGRVVEKEELLKAVWPNTFVEEANLSVNISLLRKTLGEKANEHRYIVTTPGRGYSFVAELSAGMEESSDLEMDAAHRDDVAGLGGSKSDPDRLPSSRTARMTRSLLIGSTLLLIVSAVIFYRVRYWQRDPRPSDTSIAILPFKVLEADSADEYLGSAMADVLIARLGSARQISIRPMTAVRRFLSLERDPASIGRELGVQSVLEGSIQRLDSRIRFTLHLVDAHNGKLLWAAKYDSQQADLFDVEDSISERVAAVLTPGDAPVELHRLRKRGTRNPDAYTDYLKGRYYLGKRTGENLRKAKISFQAAVDRDPDFALALAGLADCSLILGVYEQIPPNQVFPEARDYAMRALALDESLAEAHSALGFAKQHYYWDWQGSELEYRKAIELSPASADAHHWYSLFLDAVGRTDEALAEIGKAQELEPLSIAMNANVALIYYHARDYGRAILQCRRTIELDPTFARAHWYLGLACQQQGRSREAREEIQKAIDLSGEDPVMVGWKGYTFGVSGDRRAAKEVLDGLIERARHKYTTPWAVALVYIGLSDQDHAFAWLEKAFDDHSDVLSWLRAEPALDGLRSDQRFADLLRKVSLEPQSLSARLK